MGRYRQLVRVGVCLGALASPASASPAEHVTFPVEITIPENSQVRVTLEGEDWVLRQGDLVTVDFCEGITFINGSQYSPPPYEPKPVSKLRERYGAVPMVKDEVHRLSALGHTELSAWNDAYRAWSKRKGQLDRDLWGKWPQIRESAASIEEAALALEAAARQVPEMEVRKSIVRTRTVYLDRVWKMEPEPRFALPLIFRFVERDVPAYRHDPRNDAENIVEILQWLSRETFKTSYELDLTYER